MYNWLNGLEYLQDFDEEFILDLMNRHGVNNTSSILPQVISSGILGSMNSDYFLSKLGKRSLHLINGLNGGSLSYVFDKLNQIFPSLTRYEIVTDGMTDVFISGLNSKPDFRRLFICSPWIGLNNKRKAKLASAIYKAESNFNNKVSITVITRPISSEDPSYDKFLDSFRFLISMGAEIVLNKSLHSKLFIRDPGVKGGLRLCIVGSENLTRSHNIELGIKITNDSQMHTKLIRYFYSIYSRCDQWKEKSNE